MRKVKFTQDTFDEKIGRIVSEFPIIGVGLATSIHGRELTIRPFTLSSPIC
jgi:hypothetical protein